MGTLGVSDRELETYMRAALAEAEAAGQAGELPIGAGLVVDGAIVSRGHSCGQAARSQLAHAEMNVIMLGVSWSHER